MWSLVLPALKLAPKPMPYMGKDFFLIIWILLSSYNEHNTQYRRYKDLSPRYEKLWSVEWQGCEDTGEILSMPSVTDTLD